MPKFFTIGYGDQAGYDRIAPDVRNTAHAHDDELQRLGALIGVAGSPVQVRNPEASGIGTTEAAFMSSPLPIAGFAVIEAADLAEAIDWFHALRARSLAELSRSGPCEKHKLHVGLEHVRRLNDRMWVFAAVKLRPKGGGRRMAATAPPARTLAPGDSQLYRTRELKRPRPVGFGTNLRTFELKPAGL